MTKIVSTIGEAEILPNIFNVEKSDYEISNLFLGEKLGLYDSVNKHHIKIYDWFIKLKSQDWDHTEFDFSPCLTEFKTVDKNISDIMITTLAWQWEGDTVASRTIYAILAPFISSDILNTYFQRVGDNENLHALTYSEIVRNSFEDSGNIIRNVMKDQEALKRISIVIDIFEEAYITSHKYALGMVDNGQKTYNVIFMFLVAMYCLERIQFINSFAVTFSIAHTGTFVPIGEAVKKICNDELTVHAEAIKDILSIELKTKRGQLAFKQCSNKIQQLLNDVVEVERRWVFEHLFSNGRELTGLNEDILFKNCLYNAEPVYSFFGMKSRYAFPTHNNLKFIENWFQLDKSQESPQESRGGRYLLGGFKSDHITSDFSSIEL